MPPDLTGTKTHENRPAGRSAQSISTRALLAGLPYRAKGVSIISVVLDAPQDVISALAGRIGRLPGVSAKTAYSKPFPPAGD